MIRLVKGFHDILPEETTKWAFLVDTARACLQRFGFREIIAPIMERTELFERGIGQVTDIVEKEMYTFEDRGGESLSLRPEADCGNLACGCRAFAVAPRFHLEALHHWTDVPPGKTVERQIPTVSFRSMLKCWGTIPRIRMPKPLLLRMRS